MGITLIVNPGSTSKKYTLYKDGVSLFSMRFEQTGDGFGVCREKNNEQQKCESIALSVYKKAIEYFIDEAVAQHAIKYRKDIEHVGVRVVAPGTFFTRHQPITDAYLSKLEAITEVAPLHVPITLSEIYAVKALLPHVRVYAISDSAFHTTIPSYRKRIAINQEDSKTYDIQRFGYHGLSIASIAERTKSFFTDVPQRVIVCHVGGGVSATALSGHESVDTSMGYSPASGILMGSRVGQFDADALVGLLLQKKKKDVHALPEYLNNVCGFKGLVGYADLRLVLNQYATGNTEAGEALETFRYQLQRQIGGHIVVLGGLDALILTGTAVVRNPFLRSFILDGLSTSGIKLDPEKNEDLIGTEGCIQAQDSPVEIAVLKNDEMGEMVRQVTLLVE